jgi:hypothetical protein
LRTRPRAAKRVRRAARSSFALASLDLVHPCEAVYGRELWQRKDVLETARLEQVPEEAGLGGLESTSEAGTKEVPVCSRSGSQEGLDGARAQR